jgi:hypothetical protein
LRGEQAQEDEEATTKAVHQEELDTSKAHDLLVEALNHEKRDNGGHDQVGAENDRKPIDAFALPANPPDRVQLYCGEEDQDQSEDQSEELGLTTGRTVRMGEPSLLKGLPGCAGPRPQRQVQKGRHRQHHDEC